MAVASINPSPVITVEGMAVASINPSPMEWEREGPTKWEGEGGERSEPGEGDSNDRRLRMVL